MKIDRLRTLLNVFDSEYGIRDLTREIHSTIGRLRPQEAHTHTLRAFDRRETEMLLRNALPRRR